MNGDPAAPGDEVPTSDSGPGAEAALGPTLVAAPGGEPLVFEQPLNERMRAFLRIDFLYTQAVFHANSRSQWGSRAAVTSILDILAIITRTDTRADVLKELERQTMVFNDYLRRPGVDTVSPVLLPRSSFAPGEGIRNGWRWGELRAPHKAPRPFAAGFRQTSPSRTDGDSAKARLPERRAYVRGGS